MKCLVTALLATAMMLLPMTAMAAEDTNAADPGITMESYGARGDGNKWQALDLANDTWYFKICEPIDYSKVLKEQIDFSFQFEMETYSYSVELVEVILTKRGVTGDQLSSLSKDDYYYFQGALNKTNGNVYTAKLDLTNIPAGDYTLWLLLSNTSHNVFTGTNVDVSVIEKAAATKNGWYKANNKWYYGQNGKVATGFKKISGKWYFFNADGIMQKGWQISAGKWYYMASSGKMAPSGWKKISGKWYYLNKGGDMAVGFTKIKGAWYLFDENGKMTIGWQLNKGRYYYMEKSGKMATGWKKIGSKWYYLNSGGDMAEGWKKIGGKWYFFMPESGYMLSNVRANIDGKWYTFNSSGVMK